MPEEFPKSLFVYNAQFPIGEMLKRKFLEIWNEATPINLETGKPMYPIK